MKDLPHVWITNAMRSQMNEIIREAIVGHSRKKKTVEASYITVSDKDLLLQLVREFHVLETPA